MTRNAHSSVESETRGDAKRIKDNSAFPSVPIFGLFFRREKELTRAIPRTRWLWMLAVEAFFGEELLENLVVVTAANQQLTLNRLVPRGIIIDRFRGTLIEVLFYKHAVQYTMITNVNPGTVYESNGEADFSRAIFELNRGVAYQLIYFRRVYHAIYLTANLTVNTLVYFFSDNWLAALSAFVLLQLGKRVKV